MRTVTLLDLRTQSRLRADKVGSGYIKDDELTSYINASATELYDLLVGAYGNEYFAKDYAFTTVNNQRIYDLPSDFYKLEGVDYIIGPEQYLTLKPYQQSERNRFRIGTYWNAIFGAGGPRYHIKANSIEFLPIPDAGYNINLIYVPMCPKMVADGDTFDGINGWEEFIIIDAAIKMLQKEESDVSVLIGQKDAIIKRINTMAENRDAGQSFRVTDVTRIDSIWYRDDYFGVE